MATLLAVNIVCIGFQLPTIPDTFQCVSKLPFSSPGKMTIFYMKIAILYVKIAIFKVKITIIELKIAILLVKLIKTGVQMGLRAVLPS